MDNEATLLPSALAAADEIFATLPGRPVVCLDYDGTLAPIAPRPELALLPAATRETLAKLRTHASVAVISGRALPDVVTRVGIDHIYFAGNHGLEISGPGGSSHNVGADMRRHVHALDAALRARLWHVPGALIEDKRYTLSVHVRQTPAERVDEVEQIVRESVREHPDLELYKGRKVFEVRPRIDWNKGHALSWILEALGASRDAAMYIGDDRTDEDAFRVLEPTGIPVLVAAEPRATSARYQLRDPREVAVFLEALRDWLSGTGTDAPRAK